MEEIQEVISQIQVKKNERLNDMTECSICYTQYDA